MKTPELMALLLYFAGLLAIGLLFYFRAVRRFVQLAVFSIQNQQKDARAAFCYCFIF